MQYIFAVKFGSIRQGWPDRATEHHKEVTGSRWVLLSWYACMFNHIQILWFGGQSIKWMLLSWEALLVILALLSGMSCCSSVRLCCGCALLCGPIWSRTIYSQYQTQISRMPIYMQVHFALIPAYASTYNRSTTSVDMRQDTIEAKSFFLKYLNPQISQNTNFQ